MKVSTSMQRRLNESTEKYQQVKKNCYEFIGYVEFSKTGVLAESVRKNTQREIFTDEQKRAF